MNDNQSQILNSTKSVIKLFDDNAALVATVIVLSRKISALKNLVDVIETLISQQIADNTGYRIQKDAARQDAALKGIVLSDALTAYAMDTSNDILQKQVDFHLSDMRNASANDFISICTTIHDQATTHATPLADFGVTAPMITNFNNAINTFKALADAPRTAKSLTKSASQELLTKFNNLNSLNKNIDRIMGAFRLSNPAFYHAYFNAREIIENSARLVSLEGYIKDNVTNVPLEKVKIELLGTNHVKYTGVKGHYRFKSLPGGNYSLKVSKDEYFDFIQQDIGIVQNQIAKHNFNLIKKSTDIIIPPNTAICPWNGLQNSSLKITVVNRDSQPSVIWAFIAYDLDSAVPADKQIISNGSQFEYPLVNFQFGRRLYLRLINPQTDKAVKYLVEFSMVVQ